MFPAESVMSTSVGLGLGALTFFWRRIELTSDFGGFE
jgi:hypothetical protein